MTGDDAGVYKITNKISLILTVDFLPPIVNDPFLFGQIAATNSLSDVYAMGGTPITAMNICCFPIKNMPLEIFHEILNGGVKKIHEAGGILVGGHTVEDIELKYGLSVTGIVHPDKIVTNAGLKTGQALVLTKPLGTGIIASALKAKLASTKAVSQAIAVMNQLNANGPKVMTACKVSGATDITGFGLLGHALELANASNLGLKIWVNQVPILSEARDIATLGLIPIGSHSNHTFCKEKIIIKGQFKPMLYNFLTDPQTSGGLLMGLDINYLDQALTMLKKNGLTATVIGSAGVGPSGTITLSF